MRRPISEVGTRSTQDTAVFRGLLNRHHSYRFTGATMKTSFLQTDIYPCMFISESGFPRATCPHLILYIDVMEGGGGIIWWQA